MPRIWNVLFAWPLALLLASPASGQPGSLPLRPGDAFPSVSGPSLTGKPLDLPAAAMGNVAVVIFSFSRTGGNDARNWAQHLSKDDPDLSIYNVIFLESVPRMFRPIALSGIRSGMPPGVQDRTLVLFQQQHSWEQRLRATNEDVAVVAVLGRAGHLRGLSSGPLSQAAYARVRQQVRP